MRYEALCGDGTGGSGNMADNRQTTLSLLLLIHFRWIVDCNYKLLGIFSTLSHIPFSLYVSFDLRLLRTMMLMLLGYATTVDICISPFFAFLLLKCIRPLSVDIGLFLHRCSFVSFFISCCRRGFLQSKRCFHREGSWNVQLAPLFVHCLNI